jgi:ferredoxin
MAGVQSSIKRSQALFGSAAMTVRRKVLVDPHLCEGHALCLDTAPQVFDLTDDDVATCTERPADDLWDQVQAAVDACPRGAISVVEDQ